MTERFPHPRAGVQCRTPGGQVPPGVHVFQGLFCSAKPPERVHRVSSWPLRPSYSSSSTVYRTGVPHHPSVLAVLASALVNFGFSPLRE